MRVKLCQVETIKGIQKKGVEAIDKRAISSDDTGNPSWIGKALKREMEVDTYIPQGSGS